MGKLMDDGRRRFRVVFGKDGPLRYTSHLDVARIWERTLRRAELPLMYSQGFNPRPKIQLAAALPLGFSSNAELLDMWLEGDIPPLDEFEVRLNKARPAGLLVLDVEEVSLREDALQTRTDWADYEMVVDGERVSREDLIQGVADLLAQSEIIRVRREKEYDLRPLIQSLQVAEREDALMIEARLSLSAARGTGRADEIIDALGLDPAHVAIKRTAIHLAD